MTKTEFNVLYCVYNFLDNCKTVEDVRRELEAYVGQRTLTEATEFEEATEALFPVVNEDKTVTWEASKCGAAIDLLIPKSVCNDLYAPLAYSDRSILDGIVRDYKNGLITFYRANEILEYVMHSRKNAEEVAPMALKYFIHALAKESE